MLALSLAAICVVSVLSLFAYRNYLGWDARKMAAALPLDDAVVLYADIAAMRNSGLLGAITGSKAVEEAEYREFVQQSGFDYKTDLDRIAIAFQNKNRFAVATGRFDWARIKNYATSNGGQCHNGVCDVRGSSEFVDRSLSFYPMRGAAMALASTPGTGGAYSVGPTQTSRNTPYVSEWPVVTAPIWIRVPASAWRDSASLPTGARIFGSALSPATNTFFTIQPVSDRQLRLQIDAVCQTTAEAAKIQKDMEEATDLLKKMLTRDGLSPKPGDLATLLINGSFQTDGTRVRGVWPLHLELIHSIFEGEVN